MRKRSQIMFYKKYEYSLKTTVSNYFWISSSKTEIYTTSLNYNIISKKL